MPMQEQEVRRRTETLRHLPSNPVKSIFLGDLPADTELVVRTGRSTYRFRLIESKQRLLEVLEANPDFLNRGQTCQFLGAVASRHALEIKAGCVTQDLCLSLLAPLPDAPERVVVTSLVKDFHLLLPPPFRKLDV